MHVAAQFGVTGTGLAKICERYAIPTPPRGYSAKLQHGKKVKQEPFVEVEDPRLQTLVIHAGAWRLPDEVREVIQHAKARQTERQRPPPAPPEKSPEADVAPATPWPVADVHPLLRRTAQAGLQRSSGDALDRACAAVTQKLKEWLTEKAGGKPRILMDQASRPPYKRLQEDKGPLNQIMIRQNTGGLVDVAKTSRVVDAVETFRLFRVYAAAEDADALACIHSTIASEVANVAAG